MEIVKEMENEMEMEKLKSLCQNKRKLNWSQKRKNHRKAILKKLSVGGNIVIKK